MSSILIADILEARRRNFEQIIKGNGITQTAVAKRYGCKPSHIGALMKGSRPIKDNTLFRLLKALKSYNITIEDFQRGLGLSMPGEVIDKAITKYLPYAHEEDKKTIYRLLVRCANPADEAATILADFFKSPK